MTQDEAFALYREHGALWLFDYHGDPKAPHALLTSGKHSDGYVNSTPILQQPRFVSRLVENLAKELRRRYILMRPADWVVGSSYAGITFSYKLAEVLGAMHGFAEKNPLFDPNVPTQFPRFLWNRFKIPVGAIVLQCEELITTLGTAMDVRKVIEMNNPHKVSFLSSIACGIYRPKKLTGGQIDVISLAAIEIQSWDPDTEECPLCKQGSPALHVKKHWDQFVK